MHQNHILPGISLRHCGGYLAFAPQSARFQIAVTAESETEALKRFQESWDRWEASLRFEQDTAALKEIDLPVSRG